MCVCDMKFSDSSHRGRWLFTASELRAKREQLIDKSLQGIMGEAGEEAPSTSGSRSTPPAAVPRISVEEQQHLLKFYESKIMLLCSELRFPTKVRATAQVYLKRLYLGTCIIDSEPNRIMLTCIYLAGKIEEHYISAEDFTRKLQQDATAVLRNEVGVLQGLGFDLIVHSPYRALNGFFQDIEDARAAAAAATAADPGLPCSAIIGSSAGSGGGEPLDEALVSASADVINSCRNRSTSAVDALMMSDAPLMYTPGQIALAALRSGFRGAGIRIGKYLERAALRGIHAGVDGQPGTAGPTPSPSSDAAVKETVGTLNQALDELDRLGAEGAQKVDEAEVRELDRKVKQLRSLLAESGAAKQVHAGRGGAGSGAGRGAGWGGGRGGAVLLRGPSGALR